MNVCHTFVCPQQCVMFSKLSSIVCHVLKVVLNSVSCSQSTSSIVCHVLKVRPQQCVMFSKYVLNSVSCSQSTSSIVCHVLKVLHQKCVLHVRSQCVFYMCVIAELFHPCWCCIFASSFATNDDDKNQRWTFFIIRLILGIRSPNFEGNGFSPRIRQ